MLFRVERLQDTGAIPVIVQSDLRPEWGRVSVPEDYYWSPDGRPARDVETKEVQLGVMAGQVLRFRLRANPTKKTVDGKRLGILREPDQLLWFSRKGQAGGFRPITVSVVNEGLREIGGRMARGASPIRMLSALFEGHLAVTESVAFVRTVEAGVGSGKGFGFGLLSVTVGLRTAPLPRRLHEVPRFEDRWSHLYLEHCRLDQDANGLSAHDLNGVTRIPIDQLALLMLGPGTTVTHAAMRALAEDRCLVAWVGEQGVRLYAHSIGGTFSSRRIQVQARLVSDPKARLGVAHRMYQLRFDEPLGENLGINQLRGMEGIRIRKRYAELAREHGVEWGGRVYDQDDWYAGDPVNRALSAANACLYGVCHAAIVSVGLSPALGFVHSGRMLSFVYDVADLYKTEVTLPVAFRLGAAPPTNLEGEVRRACRDSIQREGIIRRILPDIERVFDAGDLLGEGADELEGRAVSMADRAEGGDIHGEPDGESEGRALGPD